MTKKDYVQFAALIAGEKSLARDKPLIFTVVDNMKLAIANIFAADNPKFDRERFYVACEPEQAVRSKTKIGNFIGTQGVMDETLDIVGNARSKGARS